MNDVDFAILQKSQWFRLPDRTLLTVFANESDARYFINRLYDNDIVRTSIWNSRKPDAEGKSVTIRQRVVPIPLNPIDLNQNNGFYVKLGYKQRIKLYNVMGDRTEEKHIGSVEDINDYMGQKEEAKPTYLSEILSHRPMWFRIDEARQPSRHVPIFSRREQVMDYVEFLQESGVITTARRAEIVKMLPHTLGETLTYYANLLPDEVAKLQNHHELRTVPDERKVQSLEAISDYMRQHTLNGQRWL